ncbi:MAG: hypothetical protein KBA70_09165 [Aquabacterium sp.]|jgi:hypothetical protein|uniref:hypothetical protein n=1 Tax=Aquabacterium sp. TaxID=1872578 RepID=UPI001B5A5EF8|nr:hypothetical protein [Aquabacterium sp.]MBP7132918.1 hypothetical protein [Aquabacterium sp.]MBP9063510.1 hypothetical protein [Aquabacterium sp.]MDQ5925793.1 hypothetical protein [Pseudomonadota bacterium]
MGFFSALNHLLNLFLPAVVLALLVPTLARVVWRAELKGRSWLRQVQWTALANATVLVLGLILVGQDGAVATYAGLVLASALVVWWTGWH